MCLANVSLSQVTPAGVAGVLINPGKSRTALPLLALSDGVRHWHTRYGEYYTADLLIPPNV